jgi:hypothetical protein
METDAMNRLEIQTYTSKKSGTPVNKLLPY